MANVEFNFTGRTAIVTGAGRGIGLELAKFFHAAGADVFALDRDESAVANAAEGGLRTRVVDVADTGSVDAAVAAIVADTGRVDIVVNNAGLLRDSVSWKISDEDWESVLAVHAGGTFRLTRACTPHFRAQRHGRVINVTSYTGLHGNFGQANYATAKAGIIGFTKTTAKELANFGVTVNAISPNAATRMIDSMPEDRRAEVAAQIPLGRFAAPAEITHAVGFLASEEAGYITGVVLPVDGGLAM
ncbi:SDR family oxidoreductase [Mycobacterium aquaticum]|uniref:3-oxoacyl-[acyl-carrier-protein] reductase MabA n=1 Tax=Mycobacterium aquaticum TaxID=1927124 RepID=A0A1W9ZYP5_9MYCO|nr:SDR family oxidoreductase [Mycobacterium aquaticum]ORA22901.1 3-oxoacyl-ACP reductase [Mycobacterium aquaticum]